MAAPPRREIPQFPIAPILRELGADYAPDVHHGQRHQKMRCPFHGPDKTPSASVSRLGFRCFTCGRSGDAISLIREEEDLSFADAIERCQELTGVTGDAVPKTSRSGAALLDI